MENLALERPDLLSSITLRFELERPLLSETPDIQSWHVTAVARDYDDSDEAGEALLTLDGDVACIATFPAPLNGSTGAARASAIKKLESVWAGLGFEPFRDGVHVLDPAHITLQDHVAGKRAALGITW